MGRWASLPPLILGLSQAQPEQLVGFLLLCHLGVCLHQRSFICVSACLPEPSRYLSHPVMFPQASSRGRPRLSQPGPWAQPLGWMCMPLGMCAPGGSRPDSRNPPLNNGRPSGLSGGVYPLSWLCEALPLLELDRLCRQLAVQGRQASSSRSAIPLSACTRVGQGPGCQEGRH